MLSLAGAATFLRLPVLADELDRVPSGVELHVDFQRLDYIDHACLETLMNWAKQHEATGGRLIVDWDLLHARFGRAAAPNAHANGHENGNGKHHPDQLAASK
jgi:MFS superfamily sulfate permease-like transporter